MVEHARTLLVSGVVPLHCNVCLHGILSWAAGTINRVRSASVVTYVRRAGTVTPSYSPLSCLRYVGIADAWRRRESDRYSARWLYSLPGKGIWVRGSARIRPVSFFCCTLDWKFGPIPLRHVPRKSLDLPSSNTVSDPTTGNLPSIHNLPVRILFRHRPSSF